MSWALVGWAAGIAAAFWLWRLAECRMWHGWGWRASVRSADEAAVGAIVGMLVILGVILLAGAGGGH